MRIREGAMLDGYAVALLKIMDSPMELGQHHVMQEILPGDPFPIRLAQGLKHAAFLRRAFILHIISLPLSCASITPKLS